MNITGLTGMFSLRTEDCVYILPETEEKDGASQGPAGRVSAKNRKLNCVKAREKLKEHILVPRRKPRDEIRALK